MRLGLIFSLPLMFLSLAFAADDDGKVPTEAKLGLFFPLEKRGETVVVARDVLLSRNVMIPAGTPIRTIFAIPTQHDEDVKKIEQTDNKKLDVAMRQDQRLKNKEINSMQKAIKERAMKTAWTDDIPFRAMLNRYIDEELFAVLVDKKDQPYITAINLPDGLLMGSGAKGGVQVLWVEPKSRGQSSGFEKGMTVVSLNGEKVENLPAFQRIYMGLSSSEIGAPNVVSIEIKRSDSQETEYLTFKRPPSLSGSILDAP